MDGTMILKGWLVITPKGFDRVTAGEPRQLKVHERAMFLEVEVPASVFTRPTLAARLRLEPTAPLLGSSIIDVTPESER